MPATAAAVGNVVGVVFALDGGELPDAASMVAVRTSASSRLSSAICSVICRLFSASRARRLDGASRASSSSARNADASSRACVATTSADACLMAALCSGSLP